MNNIPSKMKVITPLGDEEFSVDRNGNVLTVSIFKGSADLEIIEEDDNSLVASEKLNVPFDCIMTLRLGKEKASLEVSDEVVRETYIVAPCEAV